MSDYSKFLSYLRSIEGLKEAKLLFAELYQVLGAHDASELALDICADAASGNFRTGELLPYTSGIEKIKADAVREAKQNIIDNVEIPKPHTTKGEWYKAAIKHAVINLEVYADKLERGEV